MPAPVQGEANFTPALLKEAVFQVIEGRIQLQTEDYAFFDLCAGSGQMGLEALSQGYGAVHLCELNQERFRSLVETIRVYDYSVELHRKDFQNMISTITRQSRSVLYIDPPYSFWVGKDCPAIQKFLEELQTQFLNHEKTHNNTAVLEEILILVQGPYPLALQKTNQATLNPALTVETRKYRKNWLSVIHLTK